MYLGVCLRARPAMSLAEGNLLAGLSLAAAAFGIDLLGLSNQPLTSTIF
jgi:hypothetical protein